MKFCVSFTAVLMILLLVAAQCGGTASSEPQIEIKDVSVRILPTNGVIYLTIINEGGAKDALISAKTNVANIAELHETIMDDNDVMRMTPVEKYEIPVGGSVTLEPGGKHIMLMDIQGSWQAGDEIDLTLTFQQSGPMNLKVQVEAGSTGHGDDDHTDSDDTQGEHAEDMNHNDMGGMEYDEEDMDHDGEDSDHN